MSRKAKTTILVIVVIVVAACIIFLMKPKLADLGNVADISAVILSVLSLTIALMGPEQFKQFCKEHFDLSLVVTVILTIAIIIVWRLGWLEWLQIRISWPIWVLLLCLIVPFVMARVFYLYHLKTTTHQDKLAYHTIDLLRHSTHYYPRHEPPQGMVWLGGNVKFHILNGHDPEHCHYSPKGIKVQPTRLNQPQAEEVEINLPNITSVWFLIVARSGHKSRENIKFEGSQIGYIELVFSEGLPQRVPLVLGVNIREWDYGRNPEDRVGSLTDKAAREVWRSPDGYSVLDMLRVTVENGPKDPSQNPYSWGIWRRSPA